MGPKPPPPIRREDRSLQRPPSEPLPLETLDSDDPAEVVAMSRGTLASPFDHLDPEDALGEFEAIFQHAPIAMVLLNRHRVVFRMNRAAFALAGVSAVDPAGMLPGVMLCCAHLDEAGCGLGPHCPDCELRQLIDDCFVTQAGAQQVEASAPFAQGGEIHERQFRISSSFILIRERERALLCLEDITDARALQQHAGAAYLPKSPK